MHRKYLGRFLYIPETARIVRHQGKTTNRAASELMRLGLVDKNKVIYDKVGNVNEVKEKALVEALLFLPIDEDSNSKGESLPTITLERRDGDKHRYHTASRDAYSGVRAQWHDPNDAKEKSELIGEDDNPKRLRHTYPNQEAAEQAAKAEMNRVKRGKATLQFTLALGRPDITPMMGVTIPSLKAPIGDIDWIIVKTTHNVTAQGFTTQLEMETRKGQEENSSGAVDEPERQ